MSVDAVTLLTLPGPSATLESDVAVRLAALGREERHATGDEIMVAGEVCSDWHLVTRGRLQIGIGPIGRPRLTVQSASVGDLVGISWYFPPFRWVWDVVAAEPSTTVAFDAAAVRAACEADRAFEVGILRMLAAEMKDRLSHTRLQLLDLYVAPESQWS